MEQNSNITLHPQEKILSDYNYMGLKVEVVRWTDTIWCGKIGYAADLSSEPDVDAVMEAYRNADHNAVKEPESDWSACLSFNYMSEEEPHGLMVADLVQVEEQPEEFTVKKIPQATYMRITLSDETARILQKEPWHGGIPPYQWMGEIAEKFGYQYGSNELPIIEYYGFFDMTTYEHKYRYLYVPVKKCK